VRRAAFLLLFTGIAGFSIQTLIAQSSDQTLHAPSGGVRMTVVSIAVPPLPGSPFTATVTTEWKRTLDDGSTVTIGNHRTIARDNTGRIFQERRNLYPAGDSRENDINRLEFADPRAHTITTCWPTARTCQVNYYFAPSVETPPSSSGPLNGGKGFLTRLDLGSDLVSGVETIGTRETTTLDAGAIGNDRAISVVKEFWYSQQLGINVIEKRQDPRYGAQTFTVGPINLGEPDATLFDIPADFRIDDKRTPNQQSGEGLRSN
jgi:hypothetical protein